MKTIIIALILLITPISIFAENSSGYKWWVCDQLGKTKDKPMWVSSGVYFSDKNISEIEREKMFEKVIHEEVFDSFTPVLEPYCKGLEDEELAEKYLEWRLNKANKRKIHILWIKFSY